MKTLFDALPKLVFSTDVYDQGRFKYHLSVQKIKEGKAEGKIFRCIITEIAHTDREPVQFDLMKDRHGRWVDVEKGVTGYSLQVASVINERFADLMV